MEQRVRGEIPDTLIFVEHPHVVTLGRGTNTTPLPSAESGIQIFEIERGGEATYHGPGQLVAYPIIQLETPKRDLHKYLRDLEEVIIATLSHFGLQSVRNSGATGVWVNAHEPRKIASIGIAVKRWVTYHGLALNVSTNLTYFNTISPCGFNPSVMTSMTKELGRTVSVGEVKIALANAFQSVFSTQLQPMTRSPELSL